MTQIGTDIQECSVCGSLNECYTTLSRFDDGEGGLYLDFSAIEVTPDLNLQECAFCGYVGTRLDQVKESASELVPLDQYQALRENSKAHFAFAEKAHKSTSGEQQLSLSSDSKRLLNSLNAVGRHERYSLLCAEDHAAKSEAYFCIARAYEDLGQPSIAHPYYQKVIESLLNLQPFSDMDEDQLMTSLRLVDLLRRFSRFDEALELCDVLNGYEIVHAKCYEEFPLIIKYQKLLCESSDSGRHTVQEAI